MRLPFLLYRASWRALCRARKRLGSVAFSATEPGDTGIVAHLPALRCWSLGVSDQNVPVPRCSFWVAPSQLPR
ncbi:hypothetical protein PAHAL_5G082900 [Panicum hallii]|uniref:Uncharacterized protein n=1 Tax=Panicum hallii TaxID=206008 RepID=A0A2T8IJG4_9POAL|nr:hypothetical protein PAHAL_5G082900 [Panicum hallii]